MYRHKINENEDDVMGNNNSIIEKVSINERQDITTAMLGYNIVAFKQLPKIYEYLSKNTNQCKDKIKNI